MSIENEINELISNCLTKNERYTVKHLLNNIELFHKQEKSIALKSVSNDQPQEYAKVITSVLNKFLEGQDLFVNATIYNINRFTPLMMIKLTHDKVKKEVFPSEESVETELKKLDKGLWEKKAPNIYFRKKLNYKKGDDIYIIRPNQRRFWSQSMAMEDAQELILEILNGEDE